MPLRVMIVDDDQAIREILLDYVNMNLKCETVAVADAKSALAAVRAFKPDLIITDFDMPGINGIELIHEVKLTMPQITVVMISASGKIETAVNAMKAGADDYLAKPFTLEQIEALINSAREKRNNIKTLEQIQTDHIESVIAQSASIQEAANILGINASTIWRRRRSAA